MSALTAFLIGLVVGVVVGLAAAAAIYVICIGIDPSDYPAP